MTVAELIDRLSEEPMKAEVSINLNRDMPNWLVSIDSVVSYASEDTDDYVVELSCYPEED